MVKFFIIKKVIIGKNGHNKAAYVRLGIEVKKNGKGGKMEGDNSALMENKRI